MKNILGKAPKIPAKVLFSRKGDSISILLATILVKIEDSRGEQREARALLDRGSQTNLITSKLAAKLQLPQAKTQNTLSILQGKTVTSSNSVNLKVISNNSSYIKFIKCIVIDKITSNLTAQTNNASHCQIPDNIKLVDPLFSSPGPVDLLIGAELFFEVLQGVLNWVATYQF